MKRWETDEEIPPCLCPVSGEWAGTLKNSYPFIKYIPVAIVMSVSHVSGYAMIRTGKGSEILPI